MSYLGILSTAVPIAPATWTTTTTQSGFTSAIPIPQQTKKTKKSRNPPSSFDQNPSQSATAKKKKKEKTDNFTKILKLANKKPKKPQRLQFPQAILPSFLPPDSRAEVPKRTNTKP
jgi:hypothetical protein